MDTEQPDNTGRKRDELQPSEKWFADAMRDAAEATSLKDRLDTRRQKSLDMLDSGVPKWSMSHDINPALHNFQQALNEFDTHQLGTLKWNWLVALLLFFFLTWMAILSRIMLINVYWLSLPAALIIGLGFFMQRSLSRYRAKIRRETHRSSLIEKILLGPEQLQEIYRYVSWPWSLFFLGLRPQNLKGWTKLVAKNLDWYLADPRPLFRLDWSAKLVYILLCFALAVLAWNDSWNAPGDLLPLFYGLWLSIVPMFALFIGYGQQRMLVGIEELKSHILERFANADEGTA